MRFVLGKLIYGCLLFFFLLIIPGIFKNQAWAVLVCSDEGSFTRRYCAKDQYDCYYCASQVVGPYICVKATCVSNTAVAVGDCTLTGPSDCYTGCTPPPPTYTACAKIEVTPTPTTVPPTPTPTPTPAPYCRTDYLCDSTVAVNECGAIGSCTAIQRRTGIVKRYEFFGKTFVF